MRTSITEPPDGPNQWPMDDYRAFVMLLRNAYALKGDAPNVVAAVYQAAEDIGLEGGANHWLCEWVLAGCFGYFYGIGDAHVGPETFARFASAAERRRMGPGHVEWAERLASTPLERRRLMTW